MKSRFHLFHGLFAVVLVSAGNAATIDNSASTLQIDAANYVLGTQTIGVKYQFTQKTSLLETAERIQEMGSNILKFSMSRRSQRDHYNLPARDDIRSLVDLARKEPSVRAVMEMPFAYYHIWVYPFAHADAPFRDGLSPKEREETYAEVHALALHLLSTYRGTGKTFFLGHWEGDWHLHPGYDAKRDPSPVAIQGMIDWLNVRQKAIDDAKLMTPPRGVELYHYTEVNLVQKAMSGGSCLVNDVLPHTPVDYVSYSCYDTINRHRGETGKALCEALDYIESKLPIKSDIQGKRVFIGEYGFPLENATTPQKQDAYCRDVCQASLKWGCPFVLYWELYCNEKRDGKHRGFWLIDENNQKQPFYYTLQHYFTGMKQAVTQFEEEYGRQPTDEELRKKTVDVLKAASSQPIAPADADKPRR